MNSKKIKDKIHLDEKEIQELINLFRSGKFQPAKKRAIELLKKYPEAYVIHNIYGAILVNENKLNEAEAHYKKSIEIKFDYAEAHNNLGVALQKSNNLEQAVASYNNALKYKTNFAQAYNNLGSAFHRLGKFDEAIKRLSQALKIDSNYLEAYNNLGNTFTEIGKFEEAIANHRCALKIKPNYAEAYSHLGNPLTKLGKFEEAIANHRQALKINPNYAEAYCYLGNTLAEEDKFEDAITNYRLALKINPKFAEAIFGESLIRLTRGEFEIGWKKYEFRFEAIAMNSMRYKIDKVWDGNYLDGTLLVWAEQGIGDHVLFLSMLTDLKKFAKNIILEIDGRLVNLFERYCKKINFSNIEIKNMERKFTNNFDKHIALGSLGQYLRKSPNSFKTTPRKYLIPSSLKEKELRKKFFLNKKFKVGIFWKTLNKKQQNRSIELDQMLPILSNPNCDFVNLQIGNFDKKLKDIKSKYGIDIQTIKDIDNYNDIESFAALINCLDLVITVQNSTAHLAGALGKNTWLMLPKNARWHWLKNENKSLWYPSVKLFRQEKFGDWNTVVNSIGMDLKKIIEKLSN